MSATKSLTQLDKLKQRISKNLKLEKFLLPTRCANDYIFAISSLPRLPDLFSVEDLPIYRKQLDYALKAMPVKDKKYLIALEKFFVLDINDFGDVGSEFSNATYAMRLNYLFKNAPSETMQEMILALMTIDILAKTLAAKFAGERLGLSLFEMIPQLQILVNKITVNIDEPYFNLLFTYPWLKDLAALLQESDYFGAQRYIVQIKLLSLDKLSFFNVFNFEAVFVYSLKWQYLDFFIKCRKTEQIKTQVLKVLEENFAIDIQFSSTSASSSCKEDVEPSKLAGKTINSQAKTSIGK